MKIKTTVEVPEEIEISDDKKESEFQTNMEKHTSTENNKMETFSKQSQENKYFGSDQSQIQGEEIASRQKIKNNIGMGIMAGDNDSEIQSDNFMISINSLNSIDNIAKQDKKIVTHSIQSEQIPTISPDKDCRDRNFESWSLMKRFEDGKSLNIKSKVYDKKFTRRGTLLQLQGVGGKDQLIGSNRIINPQPKGGFFFALKMKRFANNLVSHLPSRRYLGLRAKHLLFFNDKTIFPDESKGIFMNITTEKNKLEEEHENNPIDSFQKRSTILLKQIYKKCVAKRFMMIVDKLPLFVPSHTTKLLWDFLNMISIAFFLIFFPLRVAFGLDMFSTIISYISLVIIILDIVVNLNTGYYGKGVLITDRTHILLNYINERMFADIISLLPFILFDFSDINSNMLSNKLKFSESIISILFLIKLKRLSQIKRKIEERFYQKKKLTNFFSLFSLLLNTLYIAHLFSCAWIVVADFKLDTDNTWMHLAGVVNDVWTIQYLYSLYFLIITMTTVGYGDIRAQNSAEHLLIIIIVLISSGVFSFSINQIGQIVSKMTEQKEKVKSTLQVINNYMNKKSINLNLQQQIREYLEYYLIESLMNDNETEDKIINMLSEPLKKSLMIEANKIALKDSPIFRNNFSDATISKTVSLIQELRCTPEEILFYEGDTECPAIFFVQKGKVELFIDSYQTNQVEIQSLKVFSKGSSFGEISFFTGEGRSISIRSIDFTTLLMIKRQDFLNILKESSQDYENFCKIKDSLTFYKNYKNIGIKCISCNSINHVLTDCPFIHYAADKQKIIRMHQLPTINERQPFEKEVRQKNLNTYFIQKDVDLLAQLYRQENIGYIEEQDWYDELPNLEEEDNQNQDQILEQPSYEDEEKKQMNQGDQRYYQKDNTSEINQLNIYSSPKREDPNYHTKDKQEITMNYSNNHSFNKLNSGVINAPCSSPLNLNSCSNNFIASASVLASNSNLVFSNSNNFLAMGNNLHFNNNTNNNNNNNNNSNNNSLTNNNNTFDTHSIKSIQKGTIELEDKREYSVFTINDLGHNPSALLSTLAGQNQSNKEQKNLNFIKRKKSVTNQNINNIISLTSNGFQQSRSNLQNEDLFSFQIQEKVIPSLNNFERGLIQNSATQIDKVTQSKKSSASKSSQLTKNNFLKKENERSVKSNVKTLSSKITVDSKINVGTSSNSMKRYMNDQIKLNQLMNIKKGAQENQFQNTLLALQGMENLLLLTKENNHTGEFDSMKSYEVYFPHNNIDVVLFQLRKKNPQLYAKCRQQTKDQNKKQNVTLTPHFLSNRMSKMDMLLKKYMSENEEDNNSQLIYEKDSNSHLKHENQKNLQSSILVNSEQDLNQINKRLQFKKSTFNTKNQTQFIDEGSSLKKSICRSSENIDNECQMPVSLQNIPQQESDTFFKKEELEALEPSSKRIMLEYQDQFSQRSQQQEQPDQKNCILMNQNKCEIQELLDLNRQYSHYKNSANIPISSSQKYLQTNTTRHSNVLQASPNNIQVDNIENPPIKLFDIIASSFNNQEISDFKLNENQMENQSFQEENDQQSIKV